jgi:mono/diheme cytochrome c family protein
MPIKVTSPHPRWRGRLLLSIAAVVLATVASWSGAQGAAQPSSGKDVFRFDTFGNETFWTDTLRLHEVIATAVDPTTALSVGLKVDADALPPGILKTADLKSPATTVALLKLNAVVGVKGTVVSKDGKDTLTRVGMTCALCHSTVDDSVMPGIGHRLDGRPNLSLNPGAIIALSPALDAAKKAVYNSWGAGKYDPRFNQDGKNMPVVIPPAFGLAGVRLATYTGDGDITYWNNYVAVTQMGGHGSFKEPRLGIAVQAKGEDLVKPKLPALREYQHSLAKPSPVAGSFDAEAAKRGQALFAGAARCASCHSGTMFTDGKLHAPAETGMEPSYAARSATKKYRATPLRALWLHPPYFHDGKAANLAAVVDHYDATLKLKLGAEQKKDLVDYLKSI